MKQIFGSKNFPADALSPVVVLGNFDGVHLGHKHIIEEAKEEAISLGGVSVVYTFNPHPVKVLAPAECPLLLQTPEQKLTELEKLNVDFCVVESFTEGFAMQSADEFFENAILKRLHAEEIIVGYDFTFGVHRHGTTEKLEKLGKKHGVEVKIVEALFLNETLISSTSIRRLIEHGDVKTAATLLGHNYIIEGRVVSGRGVGESLGAHTANIHSINELIPKNGVYLTRTNLKDKKSKPSITSIGDNPTFHNAPFTIETHILDTRVELLGKNIAIEFIDRMRDQIAFGSQDELQNQIELDIEKAKKLHLLY